MRRRFLRAIVVASLLLMTYGLAGAAGVPVWVALSDTAAAYADAARTLRAEVDHAQPGRVEWRVAHWRQFASGTPEPHWVVAVGAEALRGMQELFADDATPPPLLAILVPRPAFERIADPARLRAGSVSAVFLDQPPTRQLELIHLALPAVRKVGILVSDETRGQSIAMEKAAKELGMQIVPAAVGAGGLFPALQSVLNDSDVLLALPDPTLFNSQTAANILLAAYRRRVPLIGFSPAYVKAGALFALYSGPEQVAARAGEVLRQALAGRTFPAPQWPRDFSVAANHDVARSFGLVLDEARLAEQLRAGERR